MASHGLPEAAQPANKCGSYWAFQEHVADGLGLGGGAAGKRAACLLRRGSANIGTEGPTHHAAVQNAPPQDPVLPVEVCSTGELPELAPLRQVRGAAGVPQHIHGVIVGSSA